MIHRLLLSFAVFFPLWITATAHAQDHLLETEEDLIRETITPPASWQETQASVKRVSLENNQILVSFLPVGAEQTVSLRIMKKNPGQPSPFGCVGKTDQVVMVCGKPEEDTGMFLTTSYHRWLEQKPTLSGVESL